MDTVGVLFESLVADVPNLVRGSFKVVLGGTLLHVKGLDSFEDQGISREYFDTIAKLNSVSAAQAEDAWAIFNRFLTTLKPRPGALEWIQEQLDQRKRVVLLTHHTERARNTLTTWKVDAIKEQVHIVGYGDYVVESSCAESKAGSTSKVICGSSTLYSKYMEVKGSILIPRLVPEHVPPAPTKIMSLVELKRLPLTAEAWKNSCDFESYSSFPKLKGNVIHGLKRGSSELGCPTANLDTEIHFNDREAKCSFPITGVYFGVCTVRMPKYEGRKFGCVVNVGYCPHYSNTNPSLEVHIFHDFEGEEFYGREMELQVKGMIRVEGKYDEFEELISAIQMDCEAGTSSWGRLYNEM